MPTTQPFANCAATDSKQILLKRFTRARAKLEPDWRKKLAAAYSYYDTISGYRVISQAVDALRDDRLISLPRLEALVLAMEKLTQTQS